MLYLVFCTVFDVQSCDHCEFIDNVNFQLFALVRFFSNSYEDIQTDIQTDMAHILHVCVWLIHVCLIISHIKSIV